MKTFSKPLRANTDGRFSDKNLVRLVSILTVCIFILGLGAGLFLGRYGTQKIGHVNADELFAQFQLSKELEARLTLSQEGRKKILDSLELSYNQMISRYENEGNPAMENRLSQLSKEIEFRKYQFTQENTTQTQEYNDQIWKQLSQYVQDYCAENGYSYLLSKSRNTAVLGVNEEEDITDQVIAYVNQKYQGN